MKKILDNTVSILRRINDLASYDEKIERAESVKNRAIFNLFNKVC